MSTETDFCCLCVVLCHTGSAGRVPEQRVHAVVQHQHAEPTVGTYKLHGQTGRFVQNVVCVLIRQ